MFRPERVVPSSVYLLSIILTLVSALKVYLGLLPLVLLSLSLALPCLSSFLSCLHAGGLERFSVANHTTDNWIDCCAIRGCALVRPELYHLQAIHILPHISRHQLRLSFNDIPYGQACLRMSARQILPL